MNRSNSIPFQPVVCMLFFAGLAVVAAYSWCHAELQQSDIESRILSDAASFWTLPSTEYEQDYVLPDWIISRMDDELRGKFFRVTELNFCLDDLNSSDLAAIRSYLKFKDVRTIRIDHHCCKPEVTAILLSFKNLRTVRVDHRLTRKQPGHIDLLSGALPGIEVTCEK